MKRDQIVELSNLRKNETDLINLEKTKEFKTSDHPKTCLKQTIKNNDSKSKYGLQYSESVIERTFKLPKQTSIQTRVQSQDRFDHK